MRLICAILMILTFTAPAALAQEAHAFTPSGIDEGVIKEFEAAWRRSGNGTLTRESLILIFPNADGSYRAVPAGMTNEYKRFTFNWDPRAIAIVHTHPNSSEPEPQEEDCRLADRLRVPILTITMRGMFMYDPAGKKTTKLRNGLDWLDRSKWAREPVVASSR